MLCWAVPFLWPVFMDRMYNRAITAVMEFRALNSLKP